MALAKADHSCLDRVPLHACSIDFEEMMSFPRYSVALAMMALSLGATAQQPQTPLSQSDVNAKTVSFTSEAHAFGLQGNPKKVNRTIAVDMTDMMRFFPADITLKQGETVRFLITNKGKRLHEMVLGTLKELKTHGELMKKFPGMEHDEPYMTHVRPGRKAHMVWQFTQAGEFFYACLIPGHFEAGMVGKIKVVKG